MTSHVASTLKKKARTRGFSVYGDIRRPLALLSNNINRTKNSNEGSSSHITEESKMAISVLINKHEKTKSQLEDKNASEEKIKGEMQELRTQVQELQSTIQDDQDALEKLNSQIDMEIHEFTAIPDTQEALLESLIKKEAEIDRELFNLRDDKVIARGELWFEMKGKVDESIDHPDQASRDRNLLMRKEMFLADKRCIARDTKASLLLRKKDIQEQKSEISEGYLVEGYRRLREDSPMSQDSDEDSIVRESPLQHRRCSRISEDIEQDSVVADSQLGEDEDFVDDGSFHSDEEHQDSSWLTDSREQSFSPRSFRFSGDDHWAEESHLEVLEELQSLNIQLRTAEEKLRKSEEKFDRYRTSTRSTIERVASEAASAEGIITEYKNKLDEASNVRKRLVLDVAKLQEENARLLILAQEIALPILARTAERMKQVTRNGVQIPLNNSRLPPNKGVLRAGNNAATGGHIKSHFASIVLAEKEVVSSDLLISGEMFMTMYGISVGEYRSLYSFSKSLDRLFDMHAILIEYGCFTDMTLSKTRDSLFQNQFAQCLLGYEAIDTPSPEEKGRILMMRLDPKKSQYSMNW
ncbi:hypothetical protein EYC84_007490 [Monilinia fructicola]|uniref:Uncharacterized protein n=1 Tax=Monilinia fructicola TaxID=38448 RepID=A0A5M9JFY0_MONFR|nr:hypothetical protein EYC84_007490 [Monilinia fructicola]